MFNHVSQRRRFGAPPPANTCESKIAIMAINKFVAYLHSFTTGLTRMEIVNFCSRSRVAKRVREKCTPAVTQSRDRARYIELCMPTSLYFPRHIKARTPPPTPTPPRQRPLFPISCDTRNCGLRVYELKRHFQHNAKPRRQRETPPSARKFSNTVNVVECRFLEPILHLSARGCSRG